MLKNLIEITKNEFSGDAAKEYAIDISRHHRIQASPGFRKSAQYVKSVMREMEIECEILNFPADGKTRYWTAEMPEEWNLKQASLHLLSPENRKLADFRDVKTSIIQRSSSFEGEVELVVVDGGDEDKDYTGLDIKGKVVLSNASPRRLNDLAVGRYGAVGIIYDGLNPSPPVRSKLDLPDAVEYSSFWWGKDSQKTFGFVLSPNVGSYLRDLYKKELDKGNPPPRLKIKIDAEFYDGSTEVVEAVIPGNTEDEVLLIAHLCHPQPSANDNASGSAVLMEIARTLKQLITEGKIPKPVKGIRFLWVPEMTGTLAYLASYPDKARRMIAALNLDMVGENQNLTLSILKLTNTPMAMPSFVNALIERIGKEISSDKEESHPLFLISPTPYSGGSDHFILSDPTVNIPCPMLIQWPDLFYHTSMDTPDKIDPLMMKRVGTLSAVYAIFLSIAGEKETEWLGREMVTRYKCNLLRFIQNSLTSLSREENDGLVDARYFINRALFTLQQELEALESLKRIIHSIDTEKWRNEITSFTHQEIQKLDPFIDNKAVVSDLSELEEKASRTIPQKIHPGPFYMQYHYHRLSNKDRDVWYNLRKEHKDTFNLLPDLAIYWTDGKRSILEIANLIRLETGFNNLLLLLEFYELIEKIGEIRLIKT
ncbi:MAG: putative polysaccharide biosynthesis protein with aminopeptidase-like domain protein [candidate division WS2 bacterium]|nr:putative polysaccharide biosynthesis protein with aminopeptidase-like domain protein [Candidatus Lithacetigena glycinireducens]MBT9174792.1 putative polysaccharide biosynthesis protein with aminopeptidase-like domain protein [Candidatus Lithacetigena glycinireducens]